MYRQICQNYSTNFVEISNLGVTDKLILQRLTNGLKSMYRILLVVYPSYSATDSYIALSSLGSVLKSTG